MYQGNWKKWFDHRRHYLRLFPTLINDVGPVSFLNNFETEQTWMCNSGVPPGFFFFHNPTIPLLLRPASLQHLPSWPRSQNSFLLHFNMLPSTSAGDAVIKCYSFTELLVIEGNSVTSVKNEGCHRESNLSRISRFYNRQYSMTRSACEMSSHFKRTALPWTARSAVPLMWLNVPTSWMEV